MTVLVHFVHKVLLAFYGSVCLASANPCHAYNYRWDRLPLARPLLYHSGLYLASSFMHSMQMQIHM